MRNKIGSIFITLKEGETEADLIQELIQEYTDATCYQPDPKKKVFFRALLPERDDGQKVIKIDFFYDNLFNTRRLYNAEEIIHKLLTAPVRGKNAVYVQPDLSLWFEVFDGALNQMVATIRPRYEKLIPSFDELKSSLCYVVVQLYNKGYYLAKPIVFKSFVNQLNMEVRKTKLVQNIVSLHDPIEDLDGEVTIEDTIEDPDASQWAEDTRKVSEEEYDVENLIHVKEVCLQIMSPLRYERMLLQVRTKTISNDTAKDLMKVRRILGIKPLRKRSKEERNNGSKSLSEIFADLSP